MDKFSGQKRAAAHLFPPIDPFDQRMLDVGDGHHIYVEQCGNPEGAPVVVLHGGPGGGCSPAMRRYFDPEQWRIVLFDQRGCGRSRPHASVRANTTWHLVADIERIRDAVGIDRWAVFGGSWGATLGLVYAETHPDRVGYLALRGVFLSMQRELDWFYGGGAGQFWPDQWARFCALIPEDERRANITRPTTGASFFPATHGRDALSPRLGRALENALASDGIATGAAEKARRSYAQRLCAAGKPLFSRTRFSSRKTGKILRDSAEFAHSRPSQCGE